MWRLALIGLALAGCAERPRPYRFSAPMLARADLPAVPLADTPARPRVAPVGNRRPASAAAAAAVAHEPAAATLATTRLPAPHRAPPGEPPPSVRTPDDLRALVGRRDKRDPIAVALAWSRAIGSRVELADGATGLEVVARAEATGRIADKADARPGDVLVFDRTEGELADLVAIAIARDDRGVVAFIYLAGGVVRRGFVDPTRPALRRDADGRVVNTFMRAGKRWPPKGTHYLAGELLAHVVRTR